jgi:predicted transcriptional regulator of viral defense system
MAEQIRTMESLASVRRTKLADAVLARLEEERRGVITLYTAFHILRDIFRTGDRKKLFLRDETATTDGLRRVLDNLTDTSGIQPDRDYHRSVYQVVPLGDTPAEEVCALVNPFGYISHLSAMQHWGLTNRRPEALHLTMPPANAARPLVEERMAADYGMPFADIAWHQAVKLSFIRHPETVRGRKIEVYETKSLGTWLQVRDSHSRLATIGQTFLDTLERPQYCGGMAHVLDVWREHAAVYREEIIATVDARDAPIAKVRAGYILDEALDLGDDARVQGWANLAQRGNSRVLDPGKAFSPNYSEKWMLSINV